MVVDGQGIPLKSTIASASPLEVTLIDRVLAQIRVLRNGPGRPKINPYCLIATAHMTVINCEKICVILK